MLMRDFFMSFSVGAAGTVKSARSCASVSRISETMSVERRRASWGILLAFGGGKEGNGREGERGEEEPFVKTFGGAKGSDEREFAAADICCRCGDRRVLILDLPGWRWLGGLELGIWSLELVLVNVNGGFVESIVSESCHVQIVAMQC